MKVWNCSKNSNLAEVCGVCRLLGIDDSSFQTLATHCPNLQHLCIGFQGCEESIYHPDDYYCSVLSDAALTEVARNCHQLRSDHALLSQLGERLVYE